MSIVAVHLFLLVALGFILATLVYQSRRSVTDWANSLIVLLLVLESSRLAIMYLDAFRDETEGALLAPVIFSRLLNGPIVYLYTLFVLGLKVRFELRDLKHLIPFTVMLVATYVFSLGYAELAPHGQWRTEVQFDLSAAGLYPVGVLILMMVVLVFYAIAALRVINQFGYKLQALYADYQVTSLTWLRVLCYLHLCIALIAPFYFGLAGIGFSLAGSSIPAFGFSLVSTSGLFFLIVVYGFRQPRVFSLAGEVGEEEEAEELASATMPELEEYSAQAEVAALERYRHSTLEKAQAELFFDLLTTEIESRQMYLQQGLKINDLAQAIGLSVQEVSQVINQCSGQNFYEFINRYRIEYAKTLAKTSHQAGERLVAKQLAEQSGFRSHSTFYKHFKLYTGVTPKHYLRQLE